MIVDYGLTMQIMAVILLLYLVWGQLKLFDMLNGIGTMSAHVLLQVVPDEDGKDLSELTDRVVENEWRNWDGKQG
tara:strand:- start:18805 stop:19029 length:225 start_codon:yes stop_codon:yes gene_type:complete